MTGLVIDLFAGGGGASTGIEQALGRSVDAAVNHDPIALALHMANHPDTEHYQNDVWAVPPNHVTRGRAVDLLWASPDCTHFSKARGGKPNRDQKRRDLAWVVVKWAEQARPRVILLENVEEFRTWGPLDAHGVPVKAAAGETFRAWVRSLRRLGYKVEWRELRACDYGAPTIRKRLFLVARCDGLPIVWPEPTHGPGRPQPWRTAAECIDWSIPCPSIFSRKRPLAENTMRRIAEGIRRYVLEAAEPFIVTCNHGKQGFRGQGMDEPMKTITAAHDAHGVVMPYLTEHANASTQRTFPADAPLRTQCSEVKGGHFSVVAPYMVPRYGEREGQAPRTRPMDKPMPVVVPTGNGGSLVSPLLVGAGGPSYGGKPVELDKPMGTLMTENHQALVSAFLAKHYGGVVGTRPDQPAGTVTTVDHHGLVAAHLTKFYGKCTGSGMGEPVHTITAGGQANRDSTGSKHGLVAVHLQRDFGQSIGHAADAPCGTITGGGMGHERLVASFLTKYYGEGFNAHALGDPANTITSKDRLGLVTVTIQGQPYILADIGLRMLQPRELFRAQGFPDSYVIDLEVNGRKLSKSDQVRLCGNSVCPPIAAALVRANCADLAEHVQVRPALAGLEIGVAE